MNTHAEKVETYANEMPAELRRVIHALDTDLGLAAFFVLYKYGERTFTELMIELALPQYQKSNLLNCLKILEKSSLIKHEYVMSGNDTGRSFYDVTELGVCMITNLMNVFKVDESRSPEEGWIKGASGESYPPI